MFHNRYKKYSKIINLFSKNLKKHSKNWKKMKLIILILYVKKIWFFKKYKLEACEATNFFHNRIIDRLIQRGFNVGCQIQL